MYSVVMMAAITAGPDVSFDPLFSCGCRGGYGYAGQGTAFGCIGHVPAMKPGFFHHCRVGCCPAEAYCPPAAAPSWYPQAGQFGWVGASCLGLFPANGCGGGCHGLVTFWAPPTGMPLYTMYTSPWSRSPEVPVMVPPLPKPKVPEIPPPGEQGGATGRPATATVRLSLPAGAALYVNGSPTRQTGAEREFVTPPLVAGSRYEYDMRAEVLVGGKLEAEELKVVVTAGAQVKESFPRLVALAGRDGDRVTAK
jgi:uncharacterized protein (TIGR03000 family)